MAQVFKNFQGDPLGAVPADMVLRRSSVTADYQIAENEGTKFLRYLSSTTSAAKALSYSGAPSSGTTEIYAEIRDLQTSNPASARVLLFASDSPDNEYGLYYDRATNRIDLYSRVGGTFATVTRLTTASGLFPADKYYHVLLKIIPGNPNQLFASLWGQDEDEPAVWTIDTTSNALTISTGWSGHVGFAQDREVRYRAIGIGTDGDPAPREPIAASITLSVDSLSLSMAMDSATLTQANQLTIDDLQCQTTLDAVTLQQANVISPDEITLASQLDSAVLVSAGQLSVNDLQLNFSLDAVELQQANQLVVDGLLLTTTFESPDLSVGLTLVPDSIWLSALLDHVSLTQSHLLTVDDLTMQITLDGAFLIPGDGVLATIIMLPERGTTFRLPKRH